MKKIVFIFMLTSFVNAAKLTIEFRRNPHPKYSLVGRSLLFIPYYSSETTEEERVKIHQWLALFKSQSKNRPIWNERDNNNIINRRPDEPHDPIYLDPYARILTERKGYMAKLKITIEKEIRFGT